MADTIVFRASSFLLLLIPWAATVFWLMRRRGDETAVPFVQLWSVDASVAATSFQIRMMPWWIVFLLLAAGCGIIAAAGPLVGARWERRAHLVIDRGVTMSATNGTGEAAFESVVKHLSSEAGRGLKPISIHMVPSSKSADAPVADGLAGAVRGLKRSPIETREMLRGAIAGLLQNSQAPIIVATDQSVEPLPPRVVVVAPPQRAGNVGIVAVAAEPSPLAQAMVSVRSNTRQRAELVCRSASATVRRTIELEDDRLQTVFVDMPSLDEMVEVSVEADLNTIAADDRAWLVRSASWPRVEMRDAVPAELGRLVEVYSEQRRADDASVVVGMMTGGSDIARSDQSAVIIRTTAAAGDAAFADSLEIMSELGRGVDWSAALRGASIGSPADASWTPIVRVGGKTILAERASPARQVLVNFWSPTFGAEPDFVVLFASIFDSFAGDKPRWRSDPMFIPPASWQLVTQAVEGHEPTPGVYRDETGRLHALNAINVTLPTMETPDWQSRLAAIPWTATGGIDLLPWMIVAALALSFVGLMARRFQRPTLNAQLSTPN